MKIRIATRGSHLALAQSNAIARKLNTLGIETSVEIFKTSGDIDQSLDLAATASANDRKGLFTKEIEDALLLGKADLAVHSFKDLPTANPPGLIIACMPERIQSRDVLILPRQKKFGDSLPFLAAGSTIGTSSARRVSQIQWIWPELNCVVIRGNVPTRIEKLTRPGGPDATLLSEAGIERLKPMLDLHDFELIPLDVTLFPPAPAQGALALQCRETDSELIKTLERLSDSQNAGIVNAERSILSCLEGGCHLPLGAHATRSSHNVYSMNVFLGKESSQNRRKESFLFQRSGKEIATLASNIISEITETHPVFLTGRPERSLELQKSFGSRVQVLPLIKVEPIPIARETLDTIQRVPDPLLAFFSSSAVDIFFELKPELQSDTIFAAVGENTAARVKTLFGIDAISANIETAEGLARTLVEKKIADKRPVFALQAENGRDEFITELGKRGVQATRISLYRTLPEKVDLSQIHDSAFIIFASPSAFDSFMNQTKSMDLGRTSWKLCSIGPTTSRFMRDHDFIPYAEANSRDLESFVRELLHAERK